jgi:hypothetical protein
MSRWVTAGPTQKRLVSIGCVGGRFRVDETVHPANSKISRSRVHWNGLSGKVIEVGYRALITSLGLKLKQSLRIDGRGPGRRSVRAAMLAPALMHLFTHCFHSCEALLECRADRGLLLVV